VLSSASLVSQYKERGDLDKIDKHVGRIKSSVNHLTGILNDFLSLGKLEEGKIEISRESISLHNFLDEVVEEVKLLLKEGQNFNTSFDKGSDLITTDPKILRNILFNLISNASKYSDPGKQITLITKFEEQTVQISVKDEGIGIPEQDLKHMFDRFFRASNAINIQGSGLGLNIVKRYTDLLNGLIEFSSEVGVGSLFTVTLPRAKE
jgi:signal transduction histidine kinase